MYALCSGAVRLQGAALALLDMPLDVALDPGCGDLAFRIALSGAAATGADSRALLVSGGLNPQTNSAQTAIHVCTLEALLRFLAAMQGQQALAALRLTTFRPAVILGCIRALLWQELRGGNLHGLRVARIGKMISVTR